MITLEQIRQLEGGVKEAMKVIRNLRETNEALVARITDLEERLEEYERAAENRLADEKRIEEGFQGVLDILGEVDNGESDPVSLTAPAATVPETADSDAIIPEVEGTEPAADPPAADAPTDDAPTDDAPADDETDADAPADDDRKKVEESGEKAPEVTLDVETDAPPEDETDEKFQSEFDIF